MARGRLGRVAQRVANRTFVKAGGVRAKQMLRRAKRKANKAGRRVVAKRRTRRYSRKRRY